MEAEVARCADAEKQQRVKLLIRHYRGGIKSSFQFAALTTIIPTLALCFLHGIIDANRRLNLQATVVWACFLISYPLVFGIVYHRFLPKLIKDTLRKPSVSVIHEPLLAASITLVFAMLEAGVAIAALSKSGSPDLLISVAGMLAIGCFVLGGWSLYMLGRVCRRDRDWKARGIDGYFFVAIAIGLVTFSNWASIMLLLLTLKAVHVGME